jgi:hypothetical protein
MQPRERDYSYVGSFLAFSLWVGIGAGGILQMVYESIKDTMKSTAQALPLLGTALLVFLTVPGWMTLENYGDHDRSENYVARDYAHNMLTSVAEDAIIFTNGDNDTYPLWYLQEVEGVRTDVRVVNLSLLNTSWYIRQLKDHATYESEPLPISMSDDRVQNIRAQAWKPRQVKLPVPTSELQSRLDDYMPASPDDTTALESPMTWKLQGRSYGENRQILQVADLTVYNILRTNAENGWNRPVYFAVTVARSGQLNLQDYFQLEGQAYRVLPIKHNQPLGRVIPGLTDERMSEFRFTNLADSSAYYNENARRMVDGYRLHYSHAAERLARTGHADRGRTLLNEFTAEVPFSTIPGDVQTLMFTARAYRALGDTERLAGVLQEAQPVVFNELQTANGQRQFSRALFYAGRVRKAFTQADQTEALDAFDQRLDELLNQAPFSVPPRIRQAYGLTDDSAGQGPSMPMQGPGGGGAPQPAPGGGGGAPPSSPQN